MHFWPTRPFPASTAQIKELLGSGSGCAEADLDCGVQDLRPGWREAVRVEVV